MVGFISVKQDENGYTGRVYEAETRSYKNRWSFSANGQKALGELIEWVNDVHRKNPEMNMVGNFDIPGYETQIVDNPPLAQNLERYWEFYSIEGV